MKKILAIAGAIITLGSVVGLLFAFDARYAKTAYVAQVEYRLDQKIVQDRAAALQERLWRLEDRQGIEKAKMTDEYKRILFELNTIILKMKGK